MVEVIVADAVPAADGAPTARARLTPLPLPTRQPTPTEFGAYGRGAELGAGGFGRVFRCHRLDGAIDADEALAVKVIDLRRLRLSLNAERCLQNLQRETDILRNLPAHPNVVQMVDSVEQQHWFYLVLELVSGGDLFDALVRQAKRCLVSDEAAFVVRQLVEGLSFLHGRGIVHRDLKPENVLIASASRVGKLTMFRVKITDFGLSKAIGGGQSEAKSIVGTRTYVAPEVLSGSSYDYRVDLWSLGVLLYLLLDGRFPHESPAQAAQTTLDAAAARLRVGRPLQFLVARLLRLNPRRRLSLQELAEHPWLQAEIGQGTAEEAEAAASGGSGTPDEQAPVEELATEAFEVSSRLSSSVLALGSAEFSAVAAPLPMPPGAPAYSMASSAAAARAVVVGTESDLFGSELFNSEQDLGAAAPGPSFAVSWAEDSQPPAPKRARTGQEA